MTPSCCRPARRLAGRRLLRGPAPAVCALLGWAALEGSIGPARAQTAAPSPAPSAAAAPTGWMSSIKLSAQFEAGIVVNPMRPYDAENNGQLLTDKANQPQLNQLLLTAERDTDPKATGYDFGFKFQFMYGSDARYLHYLGEFNHALDSRYQISIIEANVTAHLPWLFASGIDAKVGQFATPLGFETINPATNPFYSHSYILNFGLPFEQTGAMAVAHASGLLDLYLGIDTGVNTTFAGGDANHEPAGMAGFGLNLLGGNLTVLALTHIGPENSCQSVPAFCDSALRYLNDAVITYKASDKLSFTTELNYIRDDGFRAEGYGAAQYASYALTDALTLNARAEVWRDNAGFYVASFPGNLDYIKSELGLPNTSIPTPRTTYGAITLGVTYKPSLPAPVSTLLIRPEIRYDRALNGRDAFSAGRNSDALTIAADAILGF